MKCPKTTEALFAVPGLMTNIPFAYSFFSTLQPGARIAAHFGPCNLRLRVHLPLTVPSADPAQCGIDVAGITRPWEDGVPMIFDDSYEHKTWNLTQQPRAILLFDVWHPDLSPEERSAAQEMFQYSKAQGWTA
jgi:aspartate beta-hydroxylase